MKIGILKCDTAMENVLQKYGDYDELFYQLLKLSDKDIKIDCFDCVSGQLPDKHNYHNYDGFIISGSRYSCYQDIEWINKLKEKIIEMDQLNIKMVGVCFGHQIILDALGGKVEPNPKGWEVSVNYIFVTEKTCQIFPETKKKYFSINQMHQDIVTKIPKDFTELFYNSNSRYQGCFKQNILTFQGHPEYNSFIINEFLKKRKDVIGSEMVNDGLQKIFNETDTLFFSEMIVKLFSN